MWPVMVPLLNCIGTIYRQRSLKAVAAGMNPMDLKRGIDLAVIKVVEAIVASATPCTDNKALLKLAQFQLTLTNQSVTS